MQNSTENVLQSPKYRSLQGNLGQGIECLCQNFNQKLINSRFCACAVKIWLKSVALNAAKLPKFKAISGKSWSPRTIVVIGLCLLSRLTWFCACADSYVVFNTGPYIIWGITQFILIVQPCTSCSVNRQIGVNDFKYVGKICLPKHGSRYTAFALSANAVSLVSCVKYQNS